MPLNPRFPLILFGLLFLTSGVLIAQKPKKPALPEGVEVIRDITYVERETGPLLLDLYRSEESTGKLPVILWVHGGGWKNGSKERCRAVGMVSHGYAVVSINYRLLDVAQWPAQINDCYEAVRWVRRNAEEYGLNGDQIAAWGSSAGGHLVALMGTRPYPGEEEIYSRVQAVCDWFGPSELLTMPPNTLGNGRTEENIANSNGAHLLGATVRDVPDLARDASALDQVDASDSTPFLIMHGSADPGVPLEQSEKLHAALQKAGVDSTLVVLDGAGHGGPEFNAPETMETVRAFFDRVLKAPAN